MVQMYLIQGFKMEGNANNVVTLKKKGYNTAVLVLLILFVMIIGGIIYYFHISLFPNQSFHHQL